MGRSRIVHALSSGFVVAVLGSIAHPAVAAVTLGASFGYTHTIYPDVADFTTNIIGLPSSQEGTQPGLRVGYVAPGGAWDVNTDFGFARRSGSSGFHQSVFELMPQFQANLPGAGGLRPFVNAGVGILYENFPDMLSVKLGFDLLVMR